MMTKEKMISIIEDLGDDASLWEYSDKELKVTLQDFEGFDTNWDEIMREYSNPDKVDKFFKILNVECITKKEDFYTTYYFKDFSLEINYASYDI